MALFSQFRTHYRFPLSYQGQLKLAAGITGIAFGAFDMCNFMAAANVLKTPASELNYHHMNESTVESGLTVLDVYCAMTSYNPVFLRAAFGVRDALCRLVGIAAIGGFSARELPSTISAGDKLDFFDVYSVSGEELVLFSDDRHLTVVVVLRLVQETGLQQRFSIVTSVNTKELLGKIYMIPVKYIHGVIVKNMINNI